MKTRNYFSLFVCVLALGFATVGCKKNPVGVTPLPKSFSGENPTDPTQQPPINPDGPIKVRDNPGDDPKFKQTEGLHTGWKEDREALKTETVYFDYDSSTIKSSEKSKIETVAAYLKSHMSAAVKVEGNCDERGTEEYNRALGERRALAIREYLINSGIAATTVDTVSYGEDKPAVQGHGEAVWKKNRRGEFVVLTP